MEEQIPSSSRYLISLPISLSDGLLPKLGTIDIYTDRICITKSMSSTKITILRNEIENISIKLNWTLVYKILFEFRSDNQLKNIRFSCGDKMSANLFSTVYLYKYFLTSYKTNQDDVSSLNKSYPQDRMPVIFIMLGMICLVTLPILLGSLHINNPLPQNLSNFMILLLEKTGLVAVMLFGGALFGLPIGILYVIQLRNILKSIPKY